MTSSIDDNNNPSAIDADSTKAEAWNWEKYVPAGFNNLSIHPGHFLLVSSLPFCYSAYRNFQKPLETIVNDVLMKQTAGKVKIEDLKLAEDQLRRVVGSALASRALRVASAASIGGFGLFGALMFYATGGQTLQEAVANTRGWAGDGRRMLDGAFGIEDRIDLQHPEILKTRNMTEEEELEYISKTYFPTEEWGDEWGEEKEEENLSTEEVVSK
jgi:hypothetical protein